LSVQLVSKISNLCDHKSPTLQTDRQTDGRHAIPRPRICTKVHCAVKTDVYHCRVSHVTDCQAEQRRNTNSFPIVWHIDDRHSVIYSLSSLLYINSMTYLPKQAMIMIRRTITISSSTAIPTTIATISSVTNTFSINQSINLSIY